MRTSRALATTLILVTIAGLGLVVFLARHRAGGSTETASPPTRVSAFAGMTPTNTSAKLTGRASWQTSAQLGWIGGTAWDSWSGWQEGSGFIAVTADGGKTWQQQYKGNVQVDRLQFIDSQVGWASGSEGKECDGGPNICQSVLLHTTDGGKHWRSVFTTPRTIEQLSFTTRDGWLITKPCVPQSFCTGSLMRTKDDGQTWSETLLPGRFLSLSRPTVNDAWIIASDKLIATHDAGDTWQPVDTPPLGSSSSVSFLTPEQGWLLTGGGPAALSQPKELFGTTDGGKTWSHLSGFRGIDRTSPTPSPEDGLGWGGYVGPMLFTSPTNGWMILEPHGLYRTTDGGKTWTVSIQEEMYDMRKASASDGWALARNNTLWTTSDGGSFWQPVALTFGEK